MKLSTALLVGCAASASALCRTPPSSSGAKTYNDGFATTSKNEFSWVQWTGYDFNAGDIAGHTGNEYPPARDYKGKALAKIDGCLWVCQDYNDKGGYPKCIGAAYVKNVGKCWLKYILGGSYNPDQDDTCPRANANVDVGYIKSYRATNPWA